MCVEVRGWEVLEMQRDTKQNMCTCVFTTSEGCATNCNWGLGLKDNFFINGVFLNSLRFFYHVNYCFDDLKKKIHLVSHKG